MVPQERVNTGMKTKTLIKAIVFQLGPFNILIPRRNMQTLHIEPPRIIGYLRPIFLRIKNITTPGQKMRLQIAPAIILFEPMLPRIVVVYIMMTFIPVSYWQIAIMNPCKVAFL